MADEEQTSVPCKVVLIGESGVGKTSIISRYITNTFSSVLTATPGASFTTKTIYLKEYKRSIKFEIWDTAGQEKYRALAKVFYKNAAESYQEYYKKYTDFKLLSFGEIEHYLETQPILPIVRKWLRNRMNK